jgi:hypothetical protein
VVVDRPMRDDQVRPKGSDQSDDLEAVLQPIVELPVGMIQNFVSGTDAPRGGLRLVPSALGQWLAVHRMMTGLAVSHAHETDDVPQIGPLRGGPASLDVGIIRVGADDENP